MKEKKKVCIAKVIYDSLTPYIQVIGWLVIVVPIIYGVSVYVDNTLAYGGQIKVNSADISDLKTNMAVMKQHIDDIWHDMGHGDNNGR